MQKIISSLFFLFILSSITASLGFTSRKIYSEHLDNSSELDSYIFSDGSTNIFADSFENSNFFLSDSTDSLNNLLFSDLSDSLNEILSSDSLVSDSLLSDSLSVGDSLAFDMQLGDSVVVVDSMAIDSTARLKHFQYIQPDYFNASATERFKSSFFLYPSAAQSQKSVELDSTGQFVLVKEIIAGKEERVMLKMPLSEYIDKMIDEVNKRGLNKLGRKFKLIVQQDDLGSLLTDITNIEIPLPSVSFLSIFGPPKISLRINGAVDIRGAWRNETTEGLTASRLGNTRNEPDFSQTVQISVNGTIGDKLTIGADWNTERTFEFENQLKLHYKGYDDEIIQSIEAGNVTMQTSPLIGGSEALFGIKAKFQFGPLTLTTLASQKKGEIQEVSVSGGSEKQEFSIQAYNYSENNYFLDTVYASTLPKYNFFNNYFGNLTPIETAASQAYFVKELEVWRTAPGQVDEAKQKVANVYINLHGILSDTSYDDALRDPNIKEEQGKTIINGRYEKLYEGVDYIYHERTGFITFKTQVQRTDAIAVAYRIEGPTTHPSDDLFFGELERNIKDSIMVLKLIKPSNLQPIFKTAWKLQLRNIYPLNGRDIDKEGFSFDMYYNVEGEEPQNNFNGVKLLKAFGFDKLDDSDGTSPDGAFDFVVGKTIIPETGEIIFPVLEPFGNNLPESLPDTIKYNSIYDTTKTFAQQDVTKNKFILKGEYSASVSSTFQIGFNVVENSVRVTLDGTELKVGTDYSVDYNIGQITMRNEAALVPGANLKITFEQNDLFQLASKTLLGLRGVYEFSKDTKLGFSFLNLNQKTLSDKVRIGEEPLNNSIYGIDFNTKHDLPFLTTALDKVFSTSAKSFVELKGEFAYMDPDPNTKKSTIPTDNGKSIAYVDDFEGSKRTIPIGIQYTTWKDLSVPDSIPFVDSEDKNEIMKYKGKSFWYNIIPSVVTTDLIWPNREVKREDRTVSVLDYVFRPNERGMYNNTPDIEGNSDKVWGGMMKALSSSANNLVDEKIEAIEFWINIINTPEGAILNLDLGQINEDVIQNLDLDTEDKQPWNDIIEEGEDTGIDGVTNVNEPNYDPVNNPDPNGDDFRLVQGGVLPEDFVSINGTEGNATLSSVGLFPDSEDLNGNKRVDKIDSYFRYEIPIDTSSAINPFVAGGGALMDNGNKSSWYLFKIPLKDFKKRIGTPSFTLVENIRLWVSGVNEDIHFQLTEFNLVGNQWQKIIDGNSVTENDTVLTVSNVSIEDNPDYYMPPGIERERDRTTAEEVAKNEQSLNLIIKDLEDGKFRTVVKYLVKGLDVFNYSEMKLFVHGDLNDLQGSISWYEDENNYATDLYFRFGADSTNYYEYIRPTKAGWEEISIKFEDLTTIKEKRPADSVTVPYRVPIPGKPGHFYGIRGNPSLTKVSFLALGISNPALKGVKFEAVSGNLWVNELRVVGADDTPGWAATASATIKLADIVTVSGNFKQSDPYFHKLSERFGNRVDSRSWGVQSNLDVLKLMPFNMPGSNLKINYSHSESISKPLYKPRTDVYVATAAASSSNPDSLKEETETMKISDTWSVSNIQLRIPTKVWYIRETINGLTFSYSYNSSSSRNPTTKISNSWIWNGSGKYQAKFSKDNYFQPANIPILGEIFKLFGDYRNVKFYFTPQSFDASVVAKRNYSYSQTRTIGVDPDIRRDFTASRNFGFNWMFTKDGFLNISTNYKLNVTSTLLYLLTDAEGNARPEKNIWDDILNGHFFGRDNNYSQNIGLNLKPKMPSFLSLDRNFTITSAYNVTYTWQNNFSQPELGRSAGWGNRISAGITVKLKSIMDPVFELAKGEKEKSTKKTPRKSSRYSRGKSKNIDDQIKDQDDKNRENSSADSLANINKPSIFNNILGIMLGSIQYVLFDYENISFNFSQNNANGNSGLRGTGSGFFNFWGVEQDEINGPNRLYQLGLSSDPGPRALGGTLTNKFSQKNNFTIKTKRPLWKGATLDINWSLGWGYNESVSLQVDSLTGYQTITNKTASGNLDRTFLTIPIAGASLTAVNDLFDPLAENANQNLSNAFLQGMESLPLLSQVPILSDIAQYIPRPNWRINWTGVEKLPLVGSLFKRASISHSYTSKYTEGWKINADGNGEIQTQKISYGFTPLVGFNFTFAELWGGNIIGNVKYSTKTDYTLGIATKATTETLSNDINFSVNFKKSGFELPLFGFSLKNDIEVSMAYTMGKNSILIYTMGENFKPEGKPQNGTKRVTIEPRVKYVMSSRVTLSIFYRRTTVEPEGASKIPATTTNEAGLDVNISIQ
ncbi:MAG: cell surface protein SprA [Melioribacteraceae bacterium]|nr:cell surface protein SprA [Melioribacteraceae bacterium]